MDTAQKQSNALPGAIARFFRRSEWGLLFAIVTVIFVTAFVDKQHTYWANPKLSIEDILRQTAMLGIFALGAAVVIIAGGIDLSSGSMIAFSGTICACLMLLLAPEEMMSPAKTVPLRFLAMAVVGTLLIGLLIGSLHAWLITIIGLPPFVATLATLVGLRSFARALVENITPLVYVGSGSTQVQLYDERFLGVVKGVPFGSLLDRWGMLPGSLRNWVPETVPLAVPIFLVLIVLIWFLLSRTVTGRHLYALGGNENAARLSGIRTDGLKWLAYCISAVLSSIAGILYIGDQSVADPQTLGQGYELNAIAAAVVGGCSLQGGAGTIPGTVLGALFLRIVIDGVAKMIKVGADVYEGLIVGGVVVAAVAFTQLRQAGRQGKQFFAGKLGLVTILNIAFITGTLTFLLGRTLAISLTLGTKVLGWFPDLAARLAKRPDFQSAVKPALGSTFLGLLVAAFFVISLFAVRLWQGYRSRQVRAAK